MTTPTTFYLNDANNPTGYAKIIDEKQGATLSAATIAQSYVLGLKVEGQSNGTSTNTFYYLTDGHGSTRALVDLEGAINQRYDYNAYGKLIAGTNLTSTGMLTNNLFGGDGVYDPATGWTYHLARWRSDFRFVSYDSFEADPTSPASLHKYNYANSNPSNFLDPSGNFTVVELLVAVTVIGVLLGGLGFAVHSAHQAANKLTLGTALWSAVSTMNFARPDAPVNFSSLGRANRLIDVGDANPMGSLAPAPITYGGDPVLGAPGNNRYQRAPAYSFPLVGKDLPALPFIAFHLTQHDDAPMLLVNFKILQYMAANSGRISKNAAASSDPSSFAIFVQGGSGVVDGGPKNPANWYCVQAGTNVPNTIKSNGYYNIPIDVQRVWNFNSGQWSPVSALAPAGPITSIPNW